jgi:hypothetical protein
MTTNVKTFETNTWAVIDVKSKCSEAIIVQNHSALAPAVHAKRYQSGRLITWALTKEFGNAKQGKTLW